MQGLMDATKIGRSIAGGTLSSHLGSVRGSFSLIHTYSQCWSMSLTDSDRLQNDCTCIIDERLHSTGSYRVWIPFRYGFRYSVWSVSWCTCDYVTRLRYQVLSDPKRRQDYDSRGRCQEGFIDAKVRSWKIRHIEGIKFSPHIPYLKYQFKYLLIYFNIIISNYILVQYHFFLYMFLMMLYLWSLPIYLLSFCPASTGLFQRSPGRRRLGPIHRKTQETARNISTTRSFHIRDMNKWYQYSIRRVFVNVFVVFQYFIFVFVFSNVCIVFFMFMFLMPSFRSQCVARITEMFGQDFYLETVFNHV